MKYLTTPLYAFTRWHRAHLIAFQKCLTLTNYQMMWIAFAKGLIISFILLKLV